MIPQYNLQLGFEGKDIYFTTSDNEVRYAKISGNKKRGEDTSLAEMSNISQKYFAILFFQEFKMTPKEYVLSMKLSLARELLSHEKASVTEVAFVLGYADVYYFSKLFKSKVGISPSEYKNRSIS